MLRFMLDHRYTGAHASDYVDGELSETSRRRVERHASRCPACRELIESLRRAVAALPSLRVRPPSRLADAVVERVGRES